MFDYLLVWMIRAGWRNRGYLWGRGGLKLFQLLFQKAHSDSGRISILRIWWKISCPTAAPRTLPIGRSFKISWRTTTAIAIVLKRQWDTARTLGKKKVCWSVCMHSKRGKRACVRSWKDKEEKWKCRKYDSNRRRIYDRREMSVHDPMWTERPSASCLLQV